MQGARRGFPPFRAPCFIRAGFYMVLQVYILAGLLVLAVVIIAFLLGRRGAGGGVDIEALRADLNSTLATHINLIAGQVRDLSMTVNSRLSSVTSQLSDQSGQFGSRMDSAARMMGDLKENLGELSKAAEEIAAIGRDISGLEEILGAPKPRGGFGEFMLGELLASSLPARYYDLQFTFRNGRRVDGVLKLSGGLLSIDSKFPLENFNRIIEAPDEDERTRARRDFASDCRRHIDAISSSYILPEEGTLDFALMYVPAENVYYEMIINSRPGAETGAKDSGLMEYAFGKKVIPVSPNTFYLYLQTIVMGLRGFEIGERTGEILKGLARLERDFAGLSSDFDTLGRHIRNAAQKHDDLGVRVRTLGAALSTLASGEGGDEE